MIGLDTNLIIRYLIQDDLEQSIRANKIMEDELTESEPGYLCTVVLIETAWVLAEAYSYPKTQILAVLTELLSAPELRFEHREEAWKAIQLARKPKIDFPDALVGLIHKTKGCQTTRTFDKGASRLDFFELA